MINCLFKTFCIYNDFITYTNLWIMLMREMRKEPYKPKEVIYEKLASK